MDFTKVLGAGVTYPGDFEPGPIIIDPPSSKLIPISPLDIAPIRAEFARYRAVLIDLKQAAQDTTVSDEASAKAAVDLAARAKKVNKAIETQRKEIIKNPQGFVKDVNTLAKAFLEPLEEVERVLRGKLNSYQIAQDRKRQEERARIEAEAAALRAKLEAESRANAVAAGIPESEAEPVPEVAVIMPEAKAITRSEEGSASIRKVWTWEVTDFAALPDQFKVVNNVELNKAVKAGLREIPGVRVYQEVQTVIR